MKSDRTLPEATACAAFMGTDCDGAGRQLKDTAGKNIQAHGGQIFKLGSLYYWYGEDKSSGLAPVGVHMYYSKDLYNWTDGGIALKTLDSMENFQQEPYKTLYQDYSVEQKKEVFRALDKNTAVVERPKVIYNVKTKQYVMWFHADGPLTDGDSPHSYGKAMAGVAVSEKAEGPFRFLSESRLHTSDRYTGNASYRGMSRDMNLYLDDRDSNGDGVPDAYILYTSVGLDGTDNGAIYISRLNADYTALDKPQGSAREGVDFAVIYCEKREGEAIFKYRNQYYLTTSACNGWTPTNSKYAVADSPLGPWTDMDSPFVDAGGDVSYETQSTCFISVDAAKGKFIYVGDRWNYRDVSRIGDSRYVFLPVDFGAGYTLLLHNVKNWTLERLGQNPGFIDAEGKALRQQAQQDYAAYLFVYFTGQNAAEQEQVYFGLSKDGYHWRQVNGNQPVLTSVLGETGVRDPFILRSPDGSKFYLIATDLCIYKYNDWSRAQTDGSKFMMVWESADLVNWSDQRMVRVAADRAGCTWAPEAVYDGQTCQYYVFWASSVPVSRGGDAVQRIYCAATKDFRSFSAPTLYYEMKDENGRPASVIDTTFQKVGSQWYRWSKAELTHHVFEETSKTLFGGWRQVDSSSLAVQDGVEAPTCFRLNHQDKWCLLLDAYGNGGYYPLISTNLSTGNFAKLKQDSYKMPGSPETRHGTVIPITQQEYDRIAGHHWTAERAESDTENDFLTQTMTVKAGQKPAFPKTVTDKNGNTVQVLWHTDGLNFSQAGTYRVHGTAGASWPLAPQRADPYVVKAADGFYYFTASYPAFGDADHGYDRIALRRAKTLAGLALAEEKTVWYAHPSGILAKHIWAPELHKIGGKWYLFFAAGASDNIWAIHPYVLQCRGNDPYEDSWMEKGQVQNMPVRDSMALDMTYFEHSGKSYVIWAQIGGKPTGGTVIGPSSLYLSEVDPYAPYILKGKTICISTPQFAWECVDEIVNEGPAALEHDGRVYVTFSASGTGEAYCMGLLTAESGADLLNPASWVKTPHPILSTTDLPGESGPGHNCFTVDENGALVMVYHSRTQGAPISGSPLYDPNRNASVCCVRWAKDGMPVLKPVAVSMTVKVQNVDA